MAGGDDKTANGVVELEVMSREDSSWHPCHVSLCPSGAALVVTYGNNDLEDTFVSEEEALAHIRVRSNPLQGDDCAHIEQGEHVLAAQKSQSPFFDAQVEKAMRVRHSKKLHCRCTFVVKWLHQDPKGESSIVPSSLIMKLAKESISDHPTISAFLNAERTTSPLPTVDNDMDSELDLHELLGKQIEEISNSADASKKVIKEDLLLGFEVHTKRQIQRRPVGASNLIRSHIEVAPVQNNLRRSTRRSNKLQTEIEVKDPPAAVPSVQEKLPENTSPANPLAARAALASFMSMLPKKLELAFYHDEGEECFVNSSDIASDKLVNLESLKVTEYFSSSVVNNFSTTVISSKTVAEPFVPKPDNIVKSLFSTTKASGTSIVLDVSSTGQTNESEKGNRTPEVINSGADFTRSMVEKNLSQPRKATRLTRAAVLKVADIPVDNVERKLKSPTNTRRVTRSASHTAAEMETVETEGVFNEKMTKRAEIATSDHNFMTHAINVSVDAIASSVDSEIDSLPTKERKCPMEIEQRNKADIEKKTFASERENVSNTRRLTRSSVHKETADTTMKMYERPAENEFPPNTDSSGGTAGALDSSVLATKEPTALSFHADIRLPLTEERNTKRKTSGHLKATQETEGNISSFNGGSQGLKRKSTSSLKHELRSSPRLRFLPRTRSQRKD